MSNTKSSQAVQSIKVSSASIHSLYVPQSCLGGLQLPKQPRAKYSKRDKESAHPQPFESLNRIVGHRLYYLIGLQGLVGRWR